MAVDALNPGPHGDYPYLSRDTAAGTYMPTGVQSQRTPDGRVVTVDVTPRRPDGTPITPPTANPSTSMEGAP